MGQKKTPTSSIAAVCLAAGAKRADFERALASGAIDPDTIVVTDGGHRKVLDARSVITALKAYVSRPDEEEDTYDLMDEKAKREHFAALREELRYLTEAGELIPREQYESEMGSLGSLVRERLEQIPSQNAARLAAITDAVKTEQELELIVRTLLTEVHSEVERRLRDE